MSIDLSNGGADNLIELVLLKVPARDLLSCNLVSTQWDRILCTKSFWIEWAETRNHQIPWGKFVANLDIHSIRQVATLQPFGRNFVRDAWDMNKMGTAECFVADPRWNFNRKIVWTNDNTTGLAPCIEIPPRFSDNGGPKVWRADDGTEETVDKCVALETSSFVKRIVIRLADEGLTDEILDKFAPPIVISELVASRRETRPSYTLQSNLQKVQQGVQTVRPLEVTNVNLLQKETRKVLPREDEGWHKIEHVFTNYPKGVGTLVVECDTGFMGLKIAQFSVKALCQFDNK